MVFITTTDSFPIITTFTHMTALLLDLIDPLGYRDATIRIRAEAAATSHLPPLPPPFILSPTRPDAPPPLAYHQLQLLPPHYHLPPLTVIERADPRITNHARMGLVVSHRVPVRGRMRAPPAASCSRPAGESWDENVQRTCSIGRSVNRLGSLHALTHATYTQLMERGREVWLREARGDEPWMRAHLAHGGCYFPRTTEFHGTDVRDHKLQSADRRRQRAMSDLRTNKMRRFYSSGRSHYTAGAGDSLTGIGVAAHMADSRKQAGLGMATYSNDDALTWCNAHVKTPHTTEAAHAHAHGHTEENDETDKYCPRGETRRLRLSMWNLKSRATDVVAYIDDFSN
ncbi:hypothetical protein Tco_0597504 [Tanacetum coccineum]